MPSYARGITAGTQWCFWGLLDATGQFYGTTGTAPAAGDQNGAAMGHFLGIQRTSPGPVEPENVPVDGDDTSLGALSFGPDEVPSFLVELGVFDLETQAILQSTLTTIIGEITIGVLQPINPEYPDMFLIIQAKAKKKDAGVEGAKAWMGYIIPRAEAVPLGRETFEHRTAATDRYKVTAQIAEMMPTGVTILEAVFGTTGAPIQPFTAENPIAQQRFTGDGAEDTFNITNFTPTSQAKTAIYVDTAPQVPGVDFTVATNVITFIAAPAADSKIQVLFEFDA